MSEPPAKPGPSIFSKTTGKKDPYARKAKRRAALPVDVAVIRVHLRREAPLGEELVRQLDLKKWVPSGLGVPVSWLVREVGRLRA